MNALAAAVPMFPAKCTPSLSEPGGGGRERFDLLYLVDPRVPSRRGMNSRAPSARNYFRNIGACAALT